MTTQQHASLPPRLPVPPNRLVGRERDLDALSEMTTDPSLRLLTLTGPGGVGKTHLALELAAHLAPRFEDGVVWVPLASTRQPELVLPSLAQRLGLREDQGQTVIEVLGNALSGLDALIILDNMEQVMEASPDIGVLVAATARPTFLLTSRSPLRLRAEREYPVLPLTLPSPEATPSVESCSMNSAVALFVDRAQALRPSFTLTEDNAPIIAEICRRLDGLPLAIELAAAMTPILSLPALLSRMDRRLPLLVMGASDLPDRQRTLRDAIEWSYDLLEPEEQALFRRLAAFARSASLESIAAVMGTDDVLPTISSLVTKSLLLRLETPEGDGAGPEPRFLMLSTIREYASERLAASGEEADTRRRHLDWLVAIGREAEPGMVGPDQVAWLDTLVRETLNIRAALAWAVEHAPVQGLALASTIWRFWATRGLLTEGYTWLCRFLEVPATIDDAICAKAYYALGNLCIDLGNLDRAHEAYSQALTLWQTLDDQVGLAGTLNGLGLVAWYRGDTSAAREYHERAYLIRQQIGDRFGEATSLNNIGNAINDAGDPATARSYHERALAIRAELQDRGGIGYSYLNLGFVERRLGHLDEAAETFGKSLAAFRDVDDRLGVGYALHGLGMVHYLRGKPEEARNHFEDALEIRGGQGDRRGIVQSIEGIAAVLVGGGHHADAATLFGAAQALREQIGWPMPEPDEAIFDPLVATIRRTLPADELARRWSEGARMQFAEVSAFAREAAARFTLPVAASPGGLSDREVEVVRLVATGLTNAEVAERLYLSRRTVDAHLRRIYDKLDLGSRSEVVRFALEHGLT